MNDNDLNLPRPKSEGLSVYDPAYPIKLLSDGLKQRMDQAKEAVHAVYQAVIKEAPLVAQVHQSLKSGYRYVVDATENTLDAIESGRIKLTTEKSGLMFSQMRDAHGKYGPKLPIKKEVFSKGIDPVQMSTTLQMTALQNQLQVVTEQLNFITNGVKQILQGQQNDRIGLYYGGLALFLEAQHMSNDDLKIILIGQALQVLSQATFQLKLTMEEDIQYLASKEYETAKGSKRKEQIDTHISRINRSFAIIHQASMLRAGIYCHLGEVAAMSTVLSEHSHFIESLVSKHALMLAQLDTADTGTERGIWRSRARLKLDVEDLTRYLNAPEKVIFLGIAKEDEHDNDMGAH